MRYIVSGAMQALPHHPAPSILPRGSQLQAAASSSGHQCCVPSDPSGSSSCCLTLWTSGQGAASLTPRIICASCTESCCAFLIADLTPSCATPLFCASARQPPWPGGGVRFMAPSARAVVACDLFSWKNSCDNAATCSNNMCTCCVGSSLH